MTIGGALSDLNNLLKADDIPVYYKPSIKAVMDTIALSSSENPKKGKWKYVKKEDSYKCSLCGFPCHKDNLGAIPTKYCAGCGAVMEV